MNTTQKIQYQKGNATIIIIILVVIVLGGIAFFFSTKGLSPRPSTLQPETVAPSLEDLSTTTPALSTTSSTTAIQQTKSWKEYKNPTIGISFDYPFDFILKSEQYSKTTGEWSSVFTSDRGHMTIEVSRNLPNVSETKLQNRTITVDNRDIILYITRRDACDAAVAHTTLDTEYRIRFTFLSCGNAIGSLIKDQKDIITALNSLDMSTENSKLFIDSNLGFAFRYPLAIPKPMIKTTSSSTNLTFNDVLQIRTGIHYDANLKKNLNAQELATAESLNGTIETVALSGKSAYQVEHTPIGSSKERKIYATNKNTNDILVIMHKGVDSESLDLILSTFTFVK